MTGPADNPWWRDAVVYQVYPRSFQDSDGDGEGDLRGVAQRLDHIRELGADALWLSPVYPSPMADGGYDVAAYDDIDPRFGTLADADALIAAAHERGLKLLLDVVPCHTSIEHPWFRDHPERYVWSDRDGPQNNWIASFGGAAWSRDARFGRWYLHSFYPEQPDLDWRRQDVRDAVGEALRFWLARGVDGFRLDAIDRLLKDPELRDDPPASGPPRLPEHADVDTLEHVHSRNAPDIGLALRALREAVGEDTLLVGEVYLPADALAPYLEHVDCAFAFELLHAPWEPGPVRAAIENALDPVGADGRIAWVLSNHDFPRLPDRYGARNTRAAALLALTLPGAVFVYQGDEIGMADGPGGDPPHDRAGRDAHRHPMRWDDDAPHGGFTSADGRPWLPAIPVEGGGVAQQAGSPGSVLCLYRDLIAARRTLGRGLTFLDDVADDVLAFRRGEDHVVALNMSDAARPAPRAGALVRATDAMHHRAGAAAPAELAAGEGFLATI
ncbi:MAG TPA: alpha-amylase family glycosyl hydrolase [Solirubrobacteraceae bacterium]|nr:alpha-amylase family glycosyl hydrolase [Solirubrobacteraceae bacterium]